MLKRTRAILISLSLLLLVGCGSPKYELYTMPEKIEMYTKALEGDKDLEKKISETREIVEKAMRNGDEKAKKEMDEWNAAQLLAEETIRGKKMAEEYRKNYKPLKLKF